MKQQLDVHESRIQKRATTPAMTRPPTGEQFDLEVGTPITGVQHTLALLRTLLASLIPVIVLIACVGWPVVTRICDRMTR